jgi:hypothetical protein
MRPLAGSPVVASAGSQRGLVEAVDRLAVLCGKGEVNRARRLSDHEREILAPLGADRDLPALERTLAAPQRAARGSVEAPGRLKIAHGERQVIEKGRAQRGGGLAAFVSGVHARARLDRRSSHDRFLSAGTQ